MRRILFRLIIIAALTGAVVLYFVAFPARLSEAEVLAELPEGFQPDPAVGETLFHMGGCAGCHASTEVVSDGALTGGAPLETPFGSFQPGNITPDPETGIGGWSDADFVTAMRLGVSPDGAHYYPAFPWTSYTRVNAEDLLHLKSYLDAQTPVAHAGPGHDLMFPFNIRLGTGAWKLLFADPGPVAADSSQSDEWNRGAYIVNGLGHCSVCHTPRNIFQAEDASRAFQGGAPLKEGEKGAPRLAGLATGKIMNGLDEWAGAVSDKSAMIHITESYSRHVPLPDHNAIATYLNSLPAPSN